MPVAARSSFTAAPLPVVTPALHGLAGTRPAAASSLWPSASRTIAASRALVAPHVAALLAAVATVAGKARPGVRRGGKVACRFRRGVSKVRRFKEESGARWDLRNRARTKTPEEAERLIKLTGILPRPLRLADVKLNHSPLQRTVVANAEERRKIADISGLYAINKLQGKFLLQRENHPVWGHERVMVYCKVMFNMLQPDARSFEPLEVTEAFKFKAAFREDDDPFFESAEKKWAKNLDEHNMRTDIIDGQALERTLSRQEKHREVRENMFNEAVLDNVLDLGELIYQYVGATIDTAATSKGSGTKINKKTERQIKRLARRIARVTGSEMEANLDLDSLLPGEGYVAPSIQEKLDEDNDIEVIEKKMSRKERRGPVGTTQGGKNPGRPYR